MKTLLKLAIRNALRNWKRNLLIGLLLLISSLVLIYYKTVIFSMKESLTNAVISNFSGHLQIQRISDRSEDPLSLDDNWDNLPANDVQQIQNYILSGNIKNVKSIAPRVRLAALLSVDGINNEGTFIYGVDTEVEFKNSKSIKALEGELLNASTPNGILLEASYAKKIKAKKGDQVVALLYGPEGYLIEEVFIVTGIIDFSGLSKWGFQVAYIPIAKARELLSMEEGSVHELVIYLNDKKWTRLAMNRLQSFLKEASLRDRVIPWYKIGNFIPNIVVILEFTFYAFFIIIFLVIIVLLINMVFLTISSRFREIGTLRAIGASTAQTTFLYILEVELVITFFTTIGAILGSFTSYLLSKRGMDAMFAYQEYAYGGSHLNVIFDPGIAVVVFFVYIGLGFLAALIPSYYAGKTKPILMMKS